MHRVMRHAGWLAAVALAAPAGAQPRADFAVSARVVSGCSIAMDAGGMVGRIDYGSHPGTAQGPVEAQLVAPGGSGIGVECTPGTNASMALDMGAHGAGGTRHVALGAERIAYALLVGSSQTPWASQSIPLSFPAGGGIQRVPLKGRLALTGAHAAGAYADTVRLTVSW